MSIWILLWTHNWESDINDLGLNDSNEGYLDINIYMHEKQTIIKLLNRNFHFN